MVFLLNNWLLVSINCSRLMTESIESFLIFNRLLPASAISPEATIELNCSAIEFAPAIFRRLTMLNHPDFLIF